MTNKEFFLETLNEEAPKFRKAIEALAEESHGHKVHDKSREAGNLAGQLALQWKAISGFVKTGRPDFNPHELSNQTKEEMLTNFDTGITELKKDIEAISDEEWETGAAGFGEELNETKYHLAWIFLFDAIHHRGQLTTYLRAMGAIVPAIYGPSADMQS
ncbi:MAG: DinB family protein [Candidatus Nomurabacteria bacterium]|nr:DinB family protein [Candidatus Nomurabacteria bacterium]